MSLSLTDFWLVITSIIPFCVAGTLFQKENTSCYTSWMLSDHICIMTEVTEVGLGYAVMQPAVGGDSKTQITPVLHFKSRQHICAFYFSAAEGDDLSCHVAEQFNNGFIIIFQKTQKTSRTGSVKCFSVCAFCVWLSEGNHLIWHISEQQNNNISAWSFLIAGENKRLQAIHLAEGLLWHRLLRARRGLRWRSRGV